MYFSYACEVFAFLSVWITLRDTFLWVRDRVANTNRTLQCTKQYWNEIRCVCTILAAERKKNTPLFFKWMPCSSWLKGNDGEKKHGNGFTVENIYIFWIHIPFVTGICVFVLENSLIAYTSLMCMDAELEPFA